MDEEDEDPKLKAAFTANIAAKMELGAPPPAQPRSMICRSLSPTRAPTACRRGSAHPRLLSAREPSSSPPRARVYAP